MEHGFAIANCSNVKPLFFHGQYLRQPKPSSFTMQTRDFFQIDAQNPNLEHRVSGLWSKN